MKRRLEELSDNEFDVLIIGGGIFGLFIAWDASLRGLSIALIDKGDFGGATSSNSLRIIHGGFRYLQSLDLGNARRFKRERGIFMKLAPDLVTPMPVLIPLYGGCSLKNLLYKIAPAIYNLLGAGIESGAVVSSGKFDSRYVSKEECLAVAPDIKQDNLSGGIMFTDCRLQDSGRFALRVAHSAFNAGARLANYVEATGIIIEDNNALGAWVKDNLTGEEFEIRAGVTVNACGPWLNKLLSGIGKDCALENFGNSKAFNILIDRKLTDGFALGLHSEIEDPKKRDLLSKDSRYLFITPFDDKSLIGTEHLPSESGPDNLKITSEEISSFVDQINSSYPAASLTTDNVKFIYGGFIPEYGGKTGRGMAGIIGHVYDHEEGRGPGGLISVSGSKYTEARIVARETIDLIMKKAAQSLAPSATDTTPLYKAEFNEPGQDKNAIAGKDDSVSSKILYAIRHEMAFKLTDIVFRRTDLGCDFESLKNNIGEYALVAARELNWDQSRIKDETDQVISRYPIFS